jgi:hypothetical protein
MYAGCVAWVAVLKRVVECWRGSAGAGGAVTRCTAVSLYCHCIAEDDILLRKELDELAAQHDSFRCAALLSPLALELASVGRAGLGTVSRCSCLLLASAPADAMASRGRDLSIWCLH